MAYHNINIDTLKVTVHSTGSQADRGGIVRTMGDEDVPLIREYGGWHTQPTGMEDGIANIGTGTELSGLARRVLMVIAIHRVMEKKNMNPGISASTICSKSVIPVTGFTGMYVYFKLGLRKDRLDIASFTINHDIINDWGTACKTYKTMSKELNEIPKLVENINKEYKKIRKKAERMMFRNRYEDTETRVEVAVAVSENDAEGEDIPCPETGLIQHS